MMDPDRMPRVLMSRIKPILDRFMAMFSCHTPPRRRGIYVCIDGVEYLWSPREDITAFESAKFAELTVLAWKTGYVNRAELERIGRHLSPSLELTRTSHEVPWLLTVAETWPIDPDIVFVVSDGDMRDVLSYWRTRRYMNWSDERIAGSYIVAGRAVVPDAHVPSRSYLSTSFDEYRRRQSSGALVEWVLAQRESDGSMS